MEPLKNYFRIQGWKRDFDCTEEDLKGLLQKLKPDFMDINFATLGYLIPATLEEIQTTTSFDGVNLSLRQRLSHRSHSSLHSKLVGHYAFALRFIPELHRNSRRGALISLSEMCGWFTTTCRT